MIIYKTTNLINGKIYIGLDTKNNPNYLGSGTAIKYAIKKYGKENFKKEIIEESFALTIDEIKELEVYWIKKLKSINKEVGYNIRNSVVYTNCGKKMTKEVTQKRKEMMTGKRNPMYGRTHTEETKQKLREKMSGEKSPRFGKHHSDEVKNKLSEYRKGVPISDKARKNIRSNYGKNNPMFGKHHSDESKRKCSECNKGKLPWNKGKDNIYSNETKERMSNSQIGKIWIYNTEKQESKRVIKNELDLYVKLGWKKGRLKKLFIF